MWEYEVRNNFEDILELIESFTECKNRILCGSGLMGRVSYEKFIYIKEIIFCRL